MTMWVRQPGQPEAHKGKEDGHLTSLCSLADGRRSISLKTAYLGESGNKPGACSHARMCIKKRFLLLKYLTEQVEHEPQRGVEKQRVVVKERQ